MANFVRVYSSRNLFRDLCFCLIGMLCWAGVCSSPATAQDYLSATGFPSFSASIPIKGGSINIANGNLHMEVVAGMFPQRGTRIVKQAFVYDSRIWQIVSNGASQQWTPSSSMGWRFKDGYGDAGAGNSATYTPCGASGYYTLSNWTWTDQHGTSHTFPITLSQDGSPASGCTLPHPTSGSAYATDSSGIQMWASSAESSAGYPVQLFEPDGTVWSPISYTDGTQTMVDPNGNYLTYGWDGPPYYFNDTLGRQLWSRSFDQDPNSYSILNSAGSTSLYSVTPGAITVSTAFGVAGVTECCTSQQTPYTVLTLPDQTTYTFGYDSYGELSSIKFPSGGTATIGYSNFTDAYGNINRWVTSYTAAGNKWTFTPQVISTCAAGQQNCQQKVTVKKPTGDYAIYTFTMNGGAWPTQAQYYDSLNNLLLTTTEGYDFSNSCAGCTGAAYVRPTTINNTIPTAGGSSISTQTTFAYDSIYYGNVTAKKEWTFYTGTPKVVPDRETDTSYLNTSAYTAKNIINRPTTVTVKNASGAQVAQTKYSYDGSALTSVTNIISHDDADYGTGNTVRGNPTSIQQWVSGSIFLTTTFTYDTTGQTLKVTDPAGHATTFSYADVFYSDNGANPPSAYTWPYPTNAYVTHITLPASGSKSTGYYFNTGKVAVSADQNGNASYSHYVDPFDRPTLSVDSSGGWTLNSYVSQTEVDTYSGITDTTKSSTCSACEHNRTLTDNLGKVTTQSLVNDPDGQTNINTTYDTDSRIQSITNPYRGTSTGAIQYSYDGIDRVVTTTKQDGNTVTSAFGPSAGSVSQLCSTSTYGIGYPTLRTDETGRKRLLWTNVFHELIEVDEPNTTNGSLTVGTCYQYDALGDLTKAVQQSETRTYVYDGLRRLLSSTIPESGITTYTYPLPSSLCSGIFGNPCTKTDARGITTTYSYDALGRLTQKAYSDGSPTIGWQYDQASVWGISLSNTKGRVSQQSTGSAQRIFSYDAVGRLISQWECLPSNCGVSTYQTAMAYDLAGDMTQVTYPSSRQVSYTYSKAKRTTQVSLTKANGQSLSYNYASGITYSPRGTPSNVTIGNNSSTNLSDSYTYNSRLQLVTATTSSSVLTAMNHTYGLTDVSGHDNGDVMSISDQLSAPRTQAFTYDQLNRLSTASETAWGLAYVYDSYGNLLQQNVTKGSAPGLTVTVNANNHIIGFGYDSAGNLTSDGAHTYQFDPENRLKSLDSGSTATYTYDVNNQRITKVTGTNTGEYILVNNRPLSLHNSANWNDWSDLVYLNGQLLAKADTYEDRICITGTTTGSQYSLFAFSGAGGYVNYVIRSGDKLFLRQWQSSGSHGGMQIAFTDGTNTNWNVNDQDGQAINNDGTQGSWHYRRIDLTGFAGKAISAIYLNQETSTTASPWTIYFTDIALLSTDGSVRPLYNRQTSISMAHSGTSSGTASINHQSNEAQLPDVTTTFYHKDHLGSSRMMSSVNGYPVWQATYLPFGYEYGAQISANNYKFTGYEHDSESGLEYAKLRHFSSQYARFVSTDPLSGDVGNPQSLNRYTYVLNNPLRGIDPTGADDDDYEQAFEDDGGGGGGGGSGSASGSGDDGSWGGFGGGASGGGGAGGSWGDDSGQVTNIVDDPNFGGSVTVTSSPSNSALDDSIAAGSGAATGGLLSTSSSDDLATTPGLDRTDFTGENAFWVGQEDGLPAAQASGANVLQLSPAAQSALDANNPSLMFQESAAYAAETTGNPVAFVGNTGAGYTFWNYELPVLEQSLEEGVIDSLTIIF